MHESQRAKVLGRFRKLINGVDEKTSFEVISTELDSELVSVLISLLQKRRWQWVLFSNVTISAGRDELTSFATILVSQVDSITIDECTQHVVLSILSTPSLELLRCLSISTCVGTRNPTHEGWAPLVPMLRNSPNLKSLTVSGHIPYESSFSRALAGANQIIRLSLCQALPRRLNHDADLEQFILGELVTPEGPDASGYGAIGQLLRPSTDPSCLQSLALNCMRLSDGHVAYMFRLLESRSNPTTFPNLMVLDLCNNRIGNDGAEAIAKSLPHAKKLERLFLGCNQIGTKGVKAIVKALPNVTTLQILDIANCTFSLEEMGDDIQAYLRQNLSLEKFTLDHDLRRIAQFHLDYYPDLNKAGRKYFLRSPKHPYSLWPRWLHQLQRGRLGPMNTTFDNSHGKSKSLLTKDLNTLYYFLRNSTILFEPREDTLSSRQTYHVEEQFSLHINIQDAYAS